MLQTDYSSFVFIFSRMASQAIFMNTGFQNFPHLKKNRNRAVKNFKNSNCQKLFVPMDQIA
jgi:hypothetical protein